MKPHSRAEKNMKRRNNFANCTQVSRKKIRHQVRLGYCCRQKGHLAKDCSWNKTMKPSNSNEV